MANVYVGIGNTDNKLTQQEWSRFIQETEILFDGLPMHGAWFSRPDAPWQNACWLADISELTSEEVDDLKNALRGVGGWYRQDSVAWAIADTEFLRQSTPTGETQ